MTDHDLDQIEARAKAALVCYMGCDASDPARCLGVRPDDGPRNGCLCPHHKGWPGKTENLIEETTTAVPALVAEVRRLRAVVDAARGFVAHVTSDNVAQWHDRIRNALALLDATPPAAGDSEAK